MSQQLSLPNDIDFQKTKAAKVSVLSNSLLVVSKLIIGILTGSVSIVSEATHSAVDLLAALIAYYAVKTSGKPPDSKHPYGHGKVENISGAVEAALIVVAALWIIYEAVQKLYVETLPEKLEYGIVIMLVSTIVNIFVSKHLFRIAKITQSHALEADALHLQADVWTSMGVLGGLLAIKLTGLYWLDPVIAITMAFVIFKAGYGMTKKSIAELMDATMTEEDKNSIAVILQEHSMVRGFTNLRTRRSGSVCLIDVHLVLDKELSLDKVHCVCDEIEQRIKARFASSEVLIHVEPSVN
ncbi:cation diffusion facilitator family transporter [Sporomusaceae bacterium BoRhaA]|uniref:cation diffusion facilitator family transporter n=1 Tax=Pelorhabdus rhamnosifermentans TaxID=2772457 RepID=UPI001FE6C379|nr:cation diffusion facilitator family transporter [Pelorhabdus rhamnosifermentans]MBU2701239.1 cation diffusion facilitator family transporter [Pelorhabdus rhamnosifermentans]